MPIGTVTKLIDDNDLPLFTNTVSAVSLGILSKKIEIFDKNGTSLGFIPVYESII